MWQSWIKLQRWKKFNLTTCKKASRWQQSWGWRETKFKATFNSIILGTIDFITLALYQHQEGLSHYTCQDSYSIPSRQSDWNSTRQCNTIWTPQVGQSGTIAFHISWYSRDFPFPVSHRKFTVAIACHAWSIWTYMISGVIMPYRWFERLLICRHLDPSYQFNCNNMAVENISKSSTFDFQTIWG